MTATTEVCPPRRQRRLRIGLLAPPWLPVPAPAYGGTESAVDALARGLAEAGHDVVLFAAAESTCPVERRAAGPAASRSELGSGSVEVAAALAGYDALADCDVIHDHTLLGPLVAIARPAGPPALVTAHGPLDGRDAALYRTIGQRVPVVAISQDQASRSPVAVAAVIHHAIDARDLPVGTGHGGFLAFLGRMNPVKGVDRAIRIARAARIPLRIGAKMSDPAECEYFRTTIEPRLGGGIEYLGELGHDEKLALLRDAVALLNPIMWDEPFGLVMIEALVGGTPVLASRRGSAPEIVRDGHNGRLCDTDADFVAALARIGEIDRAACRADVEDRFSVARLVCEHVSLYERLTAPLPRAAGER